MRGPIIATHMTQQFQNMTVYYVAEYTKKLRMTKIATERYRLLARHTCVLPVLLCTCIIS